MNDAKVKMLREALEKMQRALVRSMVGECCDGEEHHTDDCPTPRAMSAAIDALAATAEPVKPEESCPHGAKLDDCYDCQMHPTRVAQRAAVHSEPSPAPRDALSLAYESGFAAGKMHCAPRDAERVPECHGCGGLLNENGACDDEAAHREALLAFGEKVREACLRAAKAAPTMCEAGAIREIDLAALLLVRK